MDPTTFTDTLSWGIPLVVVVVVSLWIWARFNQFGNDR